MRSDDRRRNLSFRRCAVRPWWANLAIVCASDRHRRREYGIGHALHLATISQGMPFGDRECSVHITMDTDRRINMAIASGERNKEAAELIRN